MVWLRPELNASTCRDWSALTFWLVMAALWYLESGPSPVFRAETSLLKAWNESIRVSTGILHLTLARYRNLLDWYMLILGSKLGMVPGGFGCLINLLRDDRQPVTCRTCFIDCTYQLYSLSSLFVLWLPLGLSVAPSSNLSCYRTKCEALDMMPEGVKVRCSPNVRDRGTHQT